MAVTGRRRLLIISRELPPAVGPHPIRVAKLAKFLPEFGWEPTIVTVPVNHAWALDTSLEADVAGVEVVRVPRMLSGATPPTATVAVAGDGSGRTGGERPVVRRKMPKWRRQLATHLLVPDYSVLWAIPAARRASSMVRNFDAVLTTAPPFSTHLVGYWLSKRHGIPWVAEYRDNWTMNPLYRRGRVPQWINERLEQRIVGRADAIDVVSEAAAHEMVTHFRIANGRVVVARNGFDPDDLPLPAGRSDTFEFAYTGTVNRLRDPRPFFRAVMSVADRRPDLLEHFRLRLIGNVGDWAAEDALQLFGPDRVFLDGMLPHREALLRASRAAVLLLITTFAEAGGAALTSKVFEYLGLRRPILALAPPGPARDIIDSLAAGYSSNPENVQEIAVAVERLYDDWIAGRSRVAGENDLQAYTRRGTAQCVAEALELAVGTARPR
jgi:glycosyltransferase involved in cell wall biosynthesis